MTQAGDRLPWLSDEPAPAAAAAARPGSVRKTESVSRRSMWPWYLLLLLLIAGVAVGAWWLGTRQRDAPAPQLPAEQPQAVPLTPAEPVPVREAPIPLAPEVAQAEPVESRIAEQRAGRTNTERRVQRPAVIEEAPAGTEPPGEQEGFGRSVFPAEEPVAAAPPPITGPRPIVVYHPQQNRGRVVQLGAFPTRKQAEDTWRRIVRRYPYLSGKPKMVNTVEVRAIGGGRRTRMYRLQLGTSSQAQSAVICQQLERAGHSCVVVY